MNTMTTKLFGLAALLAGAWTLAGSVSAAEPVVNGDGIGYFSGYNPATHTVKLGDQDVKLTPEASASLLQQTRKWQPALDKGQLFRVKFAARAGIISSILLQPMALDPAQPPVRGRAEGKPGDALGAKAGGQQ